MAKFVENFQDLDVYRSAISFQQEIFSLSKKWPAEERYALTNQIRRSSRSIGANVAEAWAKRRYPAHFLSKLTDADGELQETVHWLSTSLACNYIEPPQTEALIATAKEIGRKLGSMIAKHESFGSRQVDGRR
jgi:four helix bundle protein